MTNLITRIDELVAQHALTRAQGEELLRAARADGLHAPPAGTVSDRARRSAVLEVLGYVGASLLIGAAVFTGFLYWGEIPALTQQLVSLAAVLVPGAAGLVLVATGWRHQVGGVLMAAALCAVAFPWAELTEQTSVLVPCLVMVIGGVAGVVLVRHWAFLVPLAAGGYWFTIDWLFLDDSPVTWRVVIGLGVTGLLVAGASRFVNRAASWSLAGLLGWGASAALSGTPFGEWGVLIASTAVAAVLFLAFVRAGTHATAAVGSLIVLSMWPWCLAALFGSSLGVALGLLAAGTVLITAVVVISRRSGRRSDAGTLVTGQTS